MDITHFNLAACNHLLGLRRERRISWRAFGLGLVITSFADKDIGEAWPSRATLEAASGIESRDIPRVTCELRDAGFMIIEEREGRSNIYRLTYGETAACGEIAAVGKQPPTCGEIAEKPVGKQPPISMNDQYRINEGSQNDENDNQTAKEKPKGNSLPLGNQTPPPTPSAPPPADKATKPQDPKVTWDDRRLIVPDALRKAWSEAYPCVDLDAAIKRASAWCLSNPGKRPKRNFTKFLNGWIGRVRPGNPEYIDPEEHEPTDAELIRGAELTFDDPDERADYWWRCKCRGEHVPRGVDCRPMPEGKEAAV